MWGYHLRADISGCNKNISDGDKITAFSKSLVKAIDMTAYGEPQVIHFGKHNPKVAGYTLIQLIETSNIAAHFCDASGEGYIDIFSCKPFGIEDAMDVIEEFFGPRASTVKYDERQAPALTAENCA